MGQSKEKRGTNQDDELWGLSLNTREARQFSLFFHPPLMIMESCYPTLNWAYYTPEILVGGIWVMYGRIKKRSWSSREKTPKDYRGGERERETKTCIKVITGSSYSPAHFWCWWVAAIMHTIIWCCLFYKLDWLHFSWKTTKLVLIGTRHKQWWPFLCSCICSKPTVALAHNSPKLHSNYLYWEFERSENQVAFMEMGYQIPLVRFLLAPLEFRSWQMRSLPTLDPYVYNFGRLILRTGSCQATLKIDETDIVKHLFWDKILGIVWIFNALCSGCSQVNILCVCRANV